MSSAVIAAAVASVVRAPRKQSTKPAADKKPATDKAAPKKTRAAAAKKTKAPAKTAKTTPTKTEAPAKAAQTEAATTPAPAQNPYHISEADYKALAATNTKTPEWSFDGQIRLAKCVKVYDGDTAHFTFIPAPGLKPARYVVRMAGYNSAELRTKDAAEKAAGVAAREYLAEIIKGKFVLLALGKADKYGRLLATVYTMPGAQTDQVVGGSAANNSLESRNVNAMMLNSGHGKAYDGAGPKNW